MHYIYIYLLDLDMAVQNEACHYKMSHAVYINKYIYSM